MEVRATAQGYYEQKIRPEGAEFTIKSEKDFSKIWMEKIEDDARPSKSAKSKKSEKPSPREVHDEALDKTLDDVNAKGDVI